MVKVLDGKRKRIYMKRRTRIEMINAVREADLLIARGVAEPSARHAVGLSKASYDLHSELLRVINPSGNGPEPEVTEEAAVYVPPEGTFAEKVEEIFGPPSEPAPPQGMQSWECPKCGRVNAIWKGTCDCYRG